MNKCVIKALLMFTVGAVSGGFTTNLFVKKKYEAIAMDQMDAYRDYIMGQVDGEILKKSEVPENVVLMDEEDTTEPGVEQEESDLERANRVNKVEYNVVAGKYSAGLEQQKTEMIGKKPSIITSEAYCTDRLDYIKLELTYYEEDDVLVDEGGDVVANGAYMVGEDTLLEFEGNADDPDIMYVRNELECVDYEITRMHESYEVSVLGYE